MAAGKLHNSTFTYPPPSQDAKVLHESRNTPHSSKEFLTWKKPANLTRRQSAELDMDLNERFYHDYIHERSDGDVGHDVMTKAQTDRPAFDPSHYIAGALQNIAHDPGRPVPKGLDLHGIARTKSAHYDRAMSRAQTRQVLSRSGSGRQGTSSGRRLSGPPDLFSSYAHANIFEEDARMTRMEQRRRSQVQPRPSPPPLPSQDAPTATRRPRSALARELDTTLNPEIIPAVEGWLSTANPKDREVASKMLRAVSRESQREPVPGRPSSASKRDRDPAGAAASKSTGRTHVQSVNMSSRDRKEVEKVHTMFDKMAKDANPGKYLPKLDPKPPPGAPPPGGRKLRRSSSDAATKGSMFGVSQRQMPSHFSIAPDWPSEATNKH